MVGSYLSKRTQLILAVCAHLLICVPVISQTYYAPQIRQTEIGRAYQKLRHASVFNLGGVGYASQITAEEQAFKTLLKSVGAIGLFQRLMSDANAEGQLYALLGLHLRAPDIFLREADNLLANGRPRERLENFMAVEKGKVRVAHGCIFFTQDRQTVIDQIARGEWDAALK